MPSALACVSRNLRLEFFPTFHSAAPRVSERLNDAHAALLGFDNASAFGVNSNRVVVAGDSAGGNLATVMCLMSRENNGPRICYQVAIYPGLDTRSRPDYASRMRLGGGDYLLNTEDIEWMRDQHLTNIKEAADWRASPPAPQPSGTDSRPSSAA